MNGIPDIDKSEFVIEPTPSGCGYHAYLPKRTATRGVGDTPEAAMEQLVRMLNPANSAAAIMDRMPVVNASTCQLLNAIARAT